MRGVRLFDGFATAWLIFWLSFIGVYIHFGSLAFAGLAILLGAVGWCVWLIRRKDWPVLDREWWRPAAAFLLFFAWLALSGFWSGAGPETALRVGAQTALAAGVPVLLLSRSPIRKQLLSRILMVMALVGAAVLALDVATGYGINLGLDPVGPDGDRIKRLADAEMNIGRGHVTYAVLAPVLLGLFATRLKRPLALIASAAFILLVLIGTVLNGLAIVPIILAFSLPALWLGYRAPRRGVSLTLGVLGGTILLAPLIGVVSRLTGEGALSRLPMSWDHRVRMWDYCLTRIMEAPLIGKGLDSSRAMQDEFTTRIGVDWPIVSLHPHNIGLQTWMEAGAIGAVLLTVAIASLSRPLQRLHSDEPWRGAAVSGTLMAVAVAGSVTVGAWQYWWWGLVAIALSLILLIPLRADR